MNIEDLNNMANSRDTIGIYIIFYATTVGCIFLRASYVKINNVTSH